jgi:hypothetical protein
MPTCQVALYSFDQYCRYRTAKFNLDSNGNIAYNIGVKNLKGVIGAHISLQNGTDLAQVFNPYVQVNGRSEIPTGQ